MDSFLVIIIPLPLIFLSRVVGDVKKRKKREMEGVKIISKKYNATRVPPKKELIKNIKEGS